MESIKLLYKYDYEIVLQDAEQILESIVDIRQISLDEWRTRYRYNDIRINFAPKIELTEGEKKQGGGTLVWRNGEAYLLIGSVNGSYGFIDSIGKDDDWELK